MNQSFEGTIKKPEQKEIKEKGQRSKQEQKRIGVVVKFPKEEDSANNSEKEKKLGQEMKGSPRKEGDKRSRRKG